MRLLELFSGTGSVGSVFKRHFRDLEVVSLDIHPKYNPTHSTDILKWDYKQYSRGEFDIIWASPPCTEYSIAKQVGVRDLDTADKIVKRTFRIIKYLSPRWWFMENPGGGGMLSKRPFMRKYEKYLNACTYCHYGSMFRKPTNIWTNLPGLKLRYCTKSDPCKWKREHNRHPMIAQHSSSSTNYNKSKRNEGAGSRENIYPIPEGLTKHIIKVMKSNNQSLHYTM